jgi:hypothetical protein
MDERLARLIDEYEATDHDRRAAVALEKELEDEYGETEPGTRRATAEARAACREAELALWHELEDGGLGVAYKGKVYVALWHIAPEGGRIPEPTHLVGVVTGIVSDDGTLAEMARMAAEYVSPYNAPDAFADFGA